MLEWLVDVAGFGSVADLTEVAESAAKSTRLNVLWWLAYERGWSLRVDGRQPMLPEQHLHPPGPRPDQTPARQQGDGEQAQPSKPRELVLGHHIAGRSGAAARWLINSGLWTTGGVCY
jgi:hypothetical protein